MRNIIVSIMGWFQRAPTHPKGTQVHGEGATPAAAETRSYTEQGISAAITRAQSGEGIKAGAKVCLLDGDTIGRLVSVEGDQGIVRFRDEDNSTTHTIKLTELFDAKLAQKLAHAFRDADLQSDL